MQTTKRKPSWAFIIFGALLAVYLGYLIGGAWEEGMNFNSFFEAFSVVTNNPVGNYFNEHTPKAVAMTLLSYAG